jgi:hypothetical protein
MKEIFQTNGIKLLQHTPAFKLFFFIFFFGLFCLLVEVMALEVAGVPMSPHMSSVPGSKRHLLLITFHCPLRTTVTLTYTAVFCHTDNTHCM